MAPLTEAIKSRFKETLSDGTLVYEGDVDPEWTIAAIPHGGYDLCLILEAVIQAQSKTAHPDVCHCVATYLRSATSGEPFTIKVQRLKTGRAFTNLHADFIQNGLVAITTNLIFSTLSDAPNEPMLPSPGALTLTQPSPLARIIPLTKPPNECRETRLVEKFNFRERMGWHEDRGFTKASVERAYREGSGSAEWACWIQLKDESEKINSACLPFFGDMFRNLPEMLPRGQRPEGPCWFPQVTMVLSIDFKVKIDGLHALRTVGLWSTGRHMQDGRHDTTVEVWTAPCELGDEGALVDEGWRRKQHCLLVSTQMALTMDLSVNESKAKARSESKL